MPSGYRSPAKFRGITASSNVGDLCGSEGNYVELRVVTKDDVEVVEVPTGSPKNQNLLHGKSSDEIANPVSSRRITRLAAL